MPQGDAAAVQRPAEPEEEGTSMFRRVIQGIAIYGLMQFGAKVYSGELFSGGTPTAQAVTDASGKTVQVPANIGDIPAYQLRPEMPNEGAVYSRIPQRIAPIWPDDSKVDIVVTISPSLVFTPLKDTAEGMVVLEENGFQIGNYSDTRSVDTTINVPVAVQNNGTLWGHFYVGLAGSQLDPTEPGYDPGAAYHFAYPLTQYVPKKKTIKTRSLLGGKDETDAAEEEEEEAEQSTGPIVGNYYHPNTTLSLIPSSEVLDFANVHAASRPFLHLESTGARDGSGLNSWYYPIVFVNTFWQLKSQMTLLNDTVKTLPLHIDLNNLAEWKFRIMSTMELSSREATRRSAYGDPMPGGGDGSEMEMVKEIFMDTNPILLCVTIAVTIAHLILETLAFGSDIAHYRKKKDNVGISVRSILANVFMQAVIFLYLIDQSQNTSWVILGSQGVGILIELWKVTTVVNVRLRPAPRGSLIPVRISFEDKHKLSDTEEKTKEYDEIAFKYMYIAGVPLLIAYAVYSLLYDEHKSWYSYVITTLVGSVYAYGFLMMIPSLYINYRLKSVAHMPGKAMIYKFLNTFIDDLFAFTIKMPFLHRMATFRDDVIFFVYIYQRYAYKTDYTRVNEFGQGGGDDEAETDKKDEGTDALPPAVAADKETTAEKATGKATGKASGKASGKATKRR